MENRELLSYILGYLFEVNKQKEIPSKKIKLIKKFIEQFEKESVEENNLNETNKFNSTESHQDLMNDFDYEKDNDQQNPNFW